MKKIITIIIVLVLVTAVAPLSAFAHGHGRSTQTVRKYILCVTENCNTTGLHYHGNICYSGHFTGDGHDYHQTCSLTGCNLTSVHEHDGTTYFGHHTDTANVTNGYSHGGSHHR